MLTVRRARLEDIEAITPLWLDMMREHESRDPRFKLATSPEAAYKGQFREMIENPDTAVFLAEEEGRAVGYLMALVLRNPPFFPNNSYGFVAEMAVAPDFRRTGIGRRLWDRALGWFRRKGVQNVQLNVSRANESGMRFWNSVGFREFLTIQWLDLEVET